LRIHAPSRTSLYLAAPAVGLAALAYAALPDAHPGYDATYAAVRGHELLEGTSLDYEYGATPHPGQIALALIAAPFGAPAAAEALLVLAFLAYAVSVIAVYVIASDLASRAVGSAAAVSTGLSLSLLIRAAEAYQDVYATGLALVALAIFMRRQELALPLALLAAAGLFRPEIWLLALAAVGWRWRHLAPRQRILAGVLAALGPAVWALFDLVAAGDPLASLTGTRLGAEVAHRLTGITAVPGAIGRNVVATVGPVVAAAAPLGLALLALTPRTKASPVVGTLAVGTISFAVLGLGELPLHDRYMFVPALLLGVLFGVAALGWTALPSGRRRRLWQLGGAMLIALAVAELPLRTGEVDRVLDDMRTRNRVITELRDVVDRSGVRSAAEHCEVQVNYAWFLPRLALELGISPAPLFRASLQADAAAPRGIVFSADERLGVRVDLVASEHVLGGPQNVYESPIFGPRLGAGYRRLAANASWRVHQRGCAPRDSG
jgi:hypothetical protein